VVRVRKIVLLLALMAAAGISWASTTLASERTTRTPSPRVIPGQYIVVLKQEIRDPVAVAREHARRHGAQILHTYQHALEGYTAQIPNKQLDEVRADSSVAYIERDSTVTIAAQKLPWGVDRLDADVSSTRAGNGSGAVTNVNAYIIDTGIKRHRDLNVVEHVNFHGGRNTDCNGHGTHVAGTLAAKDNNRSVVGVAPGASLSGVKVLGCNGSGSVASVIAGIVWVTADALKPKNFRTPAIANLSIDTLANRALDQAVRTSAASGVFYSVAAGNEGRNACKHSPARAGAGKRGRGIVTTAATNKSNREPSWSNYGSCVDLWAPGTGILSTRIGGGETTKTGTSMSAAHVGGGAALYLSSHRRARPTTVESALERDATRTGTRSKDGTAIKLLDVGSY
jgi:subtilisin family serine protease